jgi:hypothetical protein
MDTMFKVTFRNADNERNLTNGLFMHEVPARGERVHIRQKVDSWRDQQGTVTDRIWFVVDDEPNASDVVVMVTLDEKSKR